MRKVLEIDSLPESSLDASVRFFEVHLSVARRLLDDPSVTGLAIALPPADSDHDDWRRSLARDLARQASPKRVNLVGGAPGSGRDAVLAYLGNAHGVTGHYCAVHE